MKNSNNRKSHLKWLQQGRAQVCCALRPHPQALLPAFSQGDPARRCQLCPGLLSEVRISARIRLPGHDPWAGSCGRRSKRWGAGKSGVSVCGPGLWGGSRFVVGRGWGKEEGMGKVWEILAGRKAVEKKKIIHFVSYWLLGVIFWNWRIRKRNQHKASRVSQNIRPFLDFFFFLGGWPICSSKKKKWAVFYKWSDCQIKT